MKRCELSLIVLAALFVLVLIPAVSATAQTAEEWLDKGLEYGEAENWEKAAECATKAIEIAPSNEYAWADRGDTTPSWADTTKRSPT